MGNTVFTQACWFILTPQRDEQLVAFWLYTQLVFLISIMPGGQHILSPAVLINCDQIYSSEGLETIDTQSRPIGCGSAPGNSQPEGRATCGSSYPGGPGSGRVSVLRREVRLTSAALQDSQSWVCVLLALCIKLISIVIRHAEE